MPAEWLDDTNPKAREVYCELLRRMSPEERLARVFELNELQESLQRESVKRLYPAAGEREVFLRVAARRLGRETMIKAYDWDPNLHP